MQDAVLWDCVAGDLVTAPRPGERQEGHGVTYYACGKHVMVQCRCVMHRPPLLPERTSSLPCRICTPAAPEVGMAPPSLEGRESDGQLVLWDNAGQRAYGVYLNTPIHAPKFAAAVNDVFRRLRAENEALRAADKVVLALGDAATDVFEQMLKGKWADDMGHDVRLNAAMVALSTAVQKAMQWRALAGKGGERG